jgi:nitroreductase
MSYTKIIIIALLLALIYVSIKLARTQNIVKSNSQPAQPSNEEAVYENILTRTSVRVYQDKAVDSKKIERLLRAGMAAPSAADKRPWHFVVITDPEKLSGLATANPNAGFAKKAPLAIVVCGDMSKALEGGGRDFWIQDCSAASENILLEAHAMGLGAVWTGTYPSKERCEAVAKVLNLPDHLVPLNTIVIGYPANEVQPKDKWDKSNVTYFTGE